VVEFVFVFVKSGILRHEIFLESREPELELGDATSGTQRPFQLYRTHAA